MEITRDIPATRAALGAARRAGRTIGFVPTMGALHAGHISLLEAAKRDGHFVAASIFVNPTQFGPSEDLAQYPRNEAGDLEACEKIGVDLVFIPTREIMYPPDAATAVHVARLTETLCGPRRPGHFDGVCTIVAKLFNIIQPDAAYFGQKDAQQLAVVRRMTRDLDMPIDIIGCPTVRESDGLALSSRNAYLNQDQRRQALCLYNSLKNAAALIEGGETWANKIEASMLRTIRASGPIGVDYVSVVDSETMAAVERVEKRVLIAAAVRIGETRLIDNMQVDPPARSD
jgi:pantoate--beta-alanine ligase